MLPANLSLLRIIELLDAQLAVKDNSTPLNLGMALRTLCAPPYGCSIASAGLALALFVGGRKGALDFLREGQSVSVEHWLETALPRNYLELSVLDNTTLIQVSEQAVGEWVRLLNA